MTNSSLVFGETKWLGLIYFDFNSPEYVIEAVPLDIGRPVARILHGGGRGGGGGGGGRMSASGT